ncbi:DUF1015 domain-containing protein [Butyrivibrio sp. NC3005]|uniref:DUF1015 domain-containing protein n=1 Tax=Butyrivibrio sp. NC3005 TaxID=1280685 RepID=UPI000417B2C1|nr:DUF1015 family protein [Butyrivibrio sp. NC3005]
MAIVRPFKAYRPSEEYASKVAALPYDVVSSKEARAVVEDNPLSFLSIDRAEVNFTKDTDMYADKVYQKASELLEKRINEKVFIQDKKDCLYIYEQTFRNRTQTGLVCLCSVKDYEQNVIKKHENTLAKKEQDRIRHIDTCSAQTGPIFLGYKHDDQIRNYIYSFKKDKNLLYDFTSGDGVENKVYIIDDEKACKKISEMFRKTGALYIADGHHRCASAVRVANKRRNKDTEEVMDKEYEYFLSVIFPDDELMIMDYNRIVKDLNGYTKEEFLNLVSQRYEIELMGKEPYSPKEKYEAGMYLGGEWYKIKARKCCQNKDAVDNLDVAILQNEILSPILGIDDPKNDSRIDFVGGIRGLRELEKRCENGFEVAFAMFPTSIEELFNVADNKRLMPPKSTWFEPKLLSGLFIHKF